MALDRALVRHVLDHLRPCKKLGGCKLRSCACAFIDID